MLKTFRFLLTVILFSGFTSCKEEKKPTQQDLVKNNVEDYLKPKMNDPESYEFAELKLIDSVLYSDNIEYRKESFMQNLKRDKERLERQEDYKEDLPSMYDENEVAALKSSIERNEKILAEIDRLETNLGDTVNQIASYTYLFSFRGNNNLGAKVLNEYILQTHPGPNYEVIKLAENRNQVILNPNDFPGYRDMIENYIN